MRVLVIGASGFIGQHLVRRLARTSGDYIVGTFLTRPPGTDAISWRRVDLTDQAGLERLFQSARPDAVVHLAAIADVGTAERDPQRATAINVGATSAVARLCDQYRAKLVFVSTEYVFPGDRGNYREDETPEPVTHYGRTKWQAELEVARLCADWCVLRTSIVYGWPEPGERNFAPWLIESLRSGHAYNAPTEVYRTPIFVGHLCEGIERLVASNHHGICHVAGRDWVSMYDFSSAIARAFDLDTELVIPVGHAAPSGGDLLGLDCATTTSALGLEYVGLEEGIATFSSE